MQAWCSSRTMKCPFYITAFYDVQYSFYEGNSYIEYCFLHKLKGEMKRIQHSLRLEFQLFIDCEHYLV